MELWVQLFLIHFSLLTLNEPVKVRPASKVGISFCSVPVCFVYKFPFAFQSTSARKWKPSFENGSCYLPSRFFSAFPLRCSVAQESTRRHGKLFGLKNDQRAGTQLSLCTGRVLLNLGHYHGWYLLFLPLPHTHSLAERLAPLLWHREGKRCFQRSDTIGHLFPLVISQWFFNSVHIGKEVKSWIIRGKCRHSCSRSVDLSRRSFLLFSPSGAFGLVLCRSCFQKYEWSLPHMCFSRTMQRIDFFPFPIQQRSGDLTLSSVWLTLL